MEENNSRNSRNPRNPWLKTGVLLINLGTPDSPSNADVKKYLREFLMDRRVIDKNALVRWLLVNLLIVPLRAPKTAKLYRKIWTEAGSPLLVHGMELQKKLQESLGKDYLVTLAMRYQSPSIKSALEKLKAARVTKIIAVPLYPQYASSSTGSSIEKLLCEIKSWEVTPEIRIVSKFHHLPGYLDSITAAAGDCDHRAYDHVLFSFHGLPERHIRKSDADYGDGQCVFGECCETERPGNYFCYRANCVQTANALAQRLGIPREKYTVSFQSRLGRDPWLKPYSDHEIERLAKAGKKKLLVFSPAFVADCLETIYEIGIEYDGIFRKHGGEKVQLVPSLNARPEWVEALKQLVISE
ncbi:MAG TPA: ferrochelatase [Bacteroidia bacterium]|nr:ferrochelatase [Bacteroidia bacterium]